MPPLVLQELSARTGNYCFSPRHSKPQRLLHIQVKFWQWSQWQLHNPPKPISKNVFLQAVQKQQCEQRPWPGAVIKLVNISMDPLVNISMDPQTTLYFIVCPLCIFLSWIILYRAASRKLSHCYKWRPLVTTGNIKHSNWSEFLTQVAWQIPGDNVDGHRWDWCEVSLPA